MKEPITTEKVTDASLTRSIISSIIGIVLCMACLFGTTWAWYSSSVTSGVSVTEGANFDFSVEITDNVTPDANGVYTLEGGTHTVTLTRTGTVAKGYCQIIATKTGEEAGTTYYYELTEAISVAVTGSGTIKISPMWSKPEQELNNPADGIVLTPDPVATMLLPKTKTPTDVTGSPTDGETGTSGGTTADGGQTPPVAGETPSGGTSANPEPAESGTPTEPISEATAKQPTETPVETTTQE